MIYLNVYESDIKYRFQNFIFYFSSNARKERFKRKLEDFVKFETLKFKNRYGVEVNTETFETMFSFILYTKCEKRGFKIERVEGKKVSQTFTKLPTYSIYGYFDERR